MAKMFGSLPVLRRLLGEPLGLLPSPRSRSMRHWRMQRVKLELRDLGFDGVDPAATGRPAYHPSPMLKLYIYGYLNRVQ
jgi:hypothetical protein